MTAGTRFVLNRKEPVPCDDLAKWQAFMDDIAGRTVAKDVVGEFEVLTTFAGVNLGKGELPLFFETAVVDDGNPPFLSETWEQAESKHKKVVQAVNRLNQITPEDIANGHRFVSCGVLPDRLWFVMESEATAISARPEAMPNWHREGRTLVFAPPVTEPSR